MKKVLLLVLPGLLAGSVLGQEANSPEVIALKRMRDTLRTTTQRVQTAEAEAAAAQAAKVELEEKNKTLETKLQSLIKQTNAEREESDKALASLKEKNATQAGDIVRLNEALTKWKQGYQERTKVAQTTEAERSKLAARVILLDRKVADQQRRNDELYRIGTEVLKRYEGFGLGSAISAREPFTRITRARLEELIQDYRDKITDNKFNPDEKPNQKTAKK